MDAPSQKPPSPHRIVFAALTAPLIAPVLGFLLASYEATHGSYLDLTPARAYVIDGTITYGAIGYVLCLLFGLPILLVLQARGKLTGFHCLTTAALIVGGLAFAWGLLSFRVVGGLVPEYLVFGVLLFPMAFAGAAAGAAGLFALLAGLPSRAPAAQRDYGA
jgi:hypothetical protein